MNLKYANEKGVLYLVALLKAHGIKRVFASPGTTNLAFVASIQCDPYFEIYSCVDERSAAYMACGLSAETGEPVVITCTGATASRNYMSALTEAYYRKLPILAVTGTQNTDRIGQLDAQIIDRSSMPKDIATLSVNIPRIHDTIDEYFCQLKINMALCQLKRRGGGPVHINLFTSYNRDFSITSLPKVRVIQRISYDTLNKMPEFPSGRVGIFIGSHNDFTKEETIAIENFCKSRNAVVFCDHTSGYYGKYKVNFSLVAYQRGATYDLCQLDICVHIGEISAEYACIENLRKKEVWRVSPDGEIRDPFHALSYVFEMTETDFFNYYTIADSDGDDSYWLACKETYNRVYTKIDNLPFSNIWIASQIASKLPKDSVLHLGILNSTRSWNLFELPKSVRSYSNVGGFGIDGGVSSLIGASFADPNKIYFGVVGDLAFFYDMNCLGNRHVGNNIRLLIVNNGKGTEFRNFYHTGSMFGDLADKYIAAGGHYGNKSHNLVKHYAEDLNFEYLSADTKEEFLKHSDHFVSSENLGKSIVFEVFTDNQDESDALLSTWSLEKDPVSLSKNIKNAIVQRARNILGEKGLAIAKILMKK